MNPHGDCRLTAPTLAAGGAAMITEEGLCRNCLYLGHACPAYRHPPDNAVAPPAQARVAPEDLVEVVRRVERIFRPIQMSIGHILELALDPWDHIHSNVTAVVLEESNKHLSAVSNYYGTNTHHYCMMLGRVTHCHIICAHLWPNYTNGRGLAHFGLANADVNSPRNFLRLHKSIEEAFDRKKLYFEPHEYVEESTGQTIIRLKCIIVDPNLLNQSYNANNRSYSFADLNGRFSHHAFVVPTKPYLRLLCCHADKAITNAHKMNWILEGDLAARRERAIQLARQSLDDDRYNSIFQNNR